MKNIAIIGSGSWGVALAIHLAQMGHNVKIWSFAKEEADLINNDKKCMFLPKAIIPNNVICSLDFKEPFQLVVAVMLSRRNRYCISCNTIKICKKYSFTI